MCQKTKEAQAKTGQVNTMIICCSFDLTDVKDNTNSAQVEYELQRYQDTKLTSMVLHNIQILAILRMASLCTLDNKRT